MLRPGWSAPFSPPSLFSRLLILVFVGFEPFIRRPVTPLAARARKAICCHQIIYLLVFAAHPADGAAAPRLGRHRAPFPCCLVLLQVWCLLSALWASATRYCLPPRRSWKWCCALGVAQRRYHRAGAGLSLLAHPAGDRAGGELDFHSADPHRRASARRDRSAAWWATGAAFTARKMPPAPSAP